MKQQAALFREGVKYIVAPEALQIAELMDYNGVPKADWSKYSPESIFFKPPFTPTGRRTIELRGGNSPRWTLISPGTVVIEVTGEVADLEAQLRGIHTGPVSTTGWDPEIFAVDGDDKLFPAFKFLPSKEEPFLIKAYPADSEGYGPIITKAYWDGFQAEFTTKPYGCHGWAFDQLHFGLKTILQQATKADSRAKLTLKNVFELSGKELFDTTPDQIALGCDPSYNAYGTEPFRCENPFELPYRMAGGHVHLGIPGMTEERAIPLVKMLDLLVALPAVGMFADIDSPIRRQYYGRSGEFRLPPHGLEYRTLSNAWLGHPAVGNVLMDIARIATGNIKDKFTISDLGVDEDYIRAIIDNTDVQAARDFYTKNKVIWESVLYTRCFANNCISKFHQMVEQGVESVVPYYSDIEKNWHLTSGDWETHSNASHGGTWNTYCNP